MTNPTNPLENTSENTTPDPTPAERRAATSRQNLSKSKGPVTPEGKTRSARNAAKHGFLARPWLFIRSGTGTGTKKSGN